MTFTKNAFTKNCKATFVHDETLALTSRRNIYQAIADNPGIHLRELQRRLGHQPGMLEYHLNYLEKKELITSESDGYRKRFFVRAVPRFERELLTLMRLKTLRHIVVFVMLHENATFQDILQQFSFTKAALSFHLKKLVGTGILNLTTIERKNRYSVADRERIAKVLITYRSTLADTIVDRFIEMWTSL